jgi:hypothetical protein
MSKVSAEVATLRAQQVTHPACCRSLCNCAWAEGFPVKIAGIPPWGQHVLKHVDICLFKRHGDSCLVELGKSTIA